MTVDQGSCPGSVEESAPVSDAVVAIQDRVGDHAGPGKQLGAKTIWKYDLPIEDRVVLDLPIDAEVLTVQVQHRTPRLWALVTPGPTEPRSFVVVGTGNPFPPDNPLRYVATFQIYDGALVFHVFEVQPGTSP